MPITDVRKKQLAQRHRLFFKICRTCGSTGYVCCDSFRIFRVANVLCGIFLCGASNLSDENNRVCARVVSEEFENINEVESGKRITAYSETGGLSDAVAC